MKRIEDYNKVLPVIEVYTAIQSEGSRAGMPTIVVRTTGCTHRCFFGEGGWCDSWYSSIHPEKGTFCFQDIIDMYKANPHINEMMLTGGSPTMHPALVNELTYLANELLDRKITITIETEGSHFVETKYPIDLISLSPKFNNSVPKLGVNTPGGKVVDEKMIAQHDKFRMNFEVMERMMTYHKDYHFKPVWDGSETMISQIEMFRQVMKIPKSKTWVMPAGDTREELIKMYPKTMEMCIKEGYNFTGREHIIAYQDAREV